MTGFLKRVPDLCDPADIPRYLWWEVAGYVCPGTRWRSPRFSGLEEAASVGLSRKSAADHVSLQRDDRGRFLFTFRHLAAAFLAGPDASETEQWLFGVLSTGEYAPPASVGARWPAEDHDLFTSRADYADAEPVRIYPFAGKVGEDAPRLIAIDPKRGFGRPVVASRGIRVDAIASRHRGGETVDELTLECGVQKKEIEEAIRFAEALGS